MVVAIQKLDVSNDVGKINTEAMDVTTIGNGEPEQNVSPIAVKTKSVADTDVNAVKPEEPVREKYGSNGSSSPVKRKQVREKSDSETEDRGSPAKKPRSEAAERSSAEVRADKSAKMSDEDVDSGEKTPSPKKRKQTKEKSEDDDDDEEEEEEEELGRMYDSAAVKCTFC